MDSELYILGIAATAVVASCIAVVTSGGWGVIVFLPACVMVGAIHMVVHLRVVGRCVVTRRLAKLVWASAAMFLLAFLLQADEGDGPRWLIATALIPPWGGGGTPLPAWCPSWVTWIAVAPLIVSWVVLLNEARRA